MTKLVLRWVGIGTVFLGSLLVLTTLVARCSDGPIALFPGGALTSGEWVEGPVTDWSFASGVPEIELQLAAQETSRTTWILVHDGRAYVPCSLGFPPGKTWHEDARRDGRAVLRIEGRRYRATLVKVDDEATAAALERVVDAKYGGGPGEAGWFFRIDPAG